MVSRIQSFAVPWHEQWTRVLLPKQELRHRCRAARALPYNTSVLRPGPVNPFATSVPTTQRFRWSRSAACDSFRCTCNGLTVPGLLRLLGFSGECSARAGPAGSFHGQLRFSLEALLMEPALEQEMSVL